MRLTTIKYQGNECVAVQTEDGMVTLESVGIHVADMNELVRRYDELQNVITEKMAGAKTRAKDEYSVLAPIPVPMQDMVCL
ncbi:MAG: hypothetical protein IKN07_04055, partial [Lachnospiraceae bacterium]|nr:hypothetical protein [Lachnospiraceae bacterium]